MEGFELTPKQKLMIQYFLETGEKRNSAKRAGFSHASAISGHLWTSKRVRAELKKIADAERNEKIMKSNEVLERLTSIARTEQKEEICLMSRSKIERTTKEPNIKDQIKALETIAKIIGLYSDNNININNQNSVTIVDDID